MPTSFHVDTKAQERQLTEAEEPEVKYQEPEPGSYEIKGPESEQYEGAEQDQAYDYVNYTNIENPQGKHRFILAQYHTSVESLFIYYNLCIKFIGTVLIPSCMR